MTVRQIFELRFDGAPAFATAQASLAARVAERGRAIAGHLELATTEDGRVLLFVTAQGAEQLARWRDDVVEPWLGECRLAQAVVRTDATVVWPARDDDDALTDEARVERFLAAARETGTVWGLYGDTWARADVGADVEVLPFWASRAAAARCIAGDWAECVPRAIGLDAFVAQWLAGMIEDGIVVVVSPRRSHAGTIVDPAALLEALA